MLSAVSIPVGFSSPLQHSPTYGQELPIEVSIPVGFSSPLQHGHTVAKAAWVQFQSLSGFQVRCNPQK